jgi:geranylgeranyl reductase family protein
MWDVVVVGAGPAGATAALAARRARPGASVLLLDRSGFPRDKVCGDGVAPHALDVLEALGVAGLVDDWAPVRRLRLARGEADVERLMRRPARVVPRSVFDARLVDAAVAAGAELRQHRVRSVASSPDGVRLDDVLEARVVVAADGAHSVLRRAVGGERTRRAGRRALAFRAYAPTTDAGGGRQVIRFGQRRQPSYAWAFDRGDGWSNVGYGEVLGRGDPPSRGAMTAALDHLLPGVSEGAVEWRAHHLPLSAARWWQPDGRVLLAGDAASLVNPMTGEGIFYAVTTGALAGQVAVTAPAADAGRRHRVAVRSLLASHLRQTAVVSRLLPVPGVVPAGIRAAAVEQGVFDDLVELGLGRGHLTPAVAAGVVRHLRG